MTPEAPGEQLNLDLSKYKEFDPSSLIGSCSSIRSAVSAGIDDVIEVVKMTSEVNTDLKMPIFAEPNYLVEVAELWLVVALRGAGECRRHRCKSILHRRQPI